MKIDFNSIALVSMHFSSFSFHLGVYRDLDGVCVYKHKSDGSLELEENDWYIWGRATEEYDFCLEYFGLGPLFLVCWPP